MNQDPRTSSASVQSRTAIFIAITVVTLTCLCSALWFPSLAAPYSNVTSRNAFALLPLLEPAGTVATAPLIISEFRLRGPNGPNDEFVEIYNNSDTPHTVSAFDGSSGYALVGSSNATINDGLVSTRFVIPNGTVIPARGHFLAVNSVGYSLANYPAGNGITAVGNISYTIQIPDNVGIALFETSFAGNYTLPNRIDAVGSDADTNALYREGAGYSAISSSALEGSFFRKLAGGCTGSGSGNCNSVVLISTTLGPSSSYPQDTGNNANDFLYADTVGTNVGPSQRLGAPGPENLSSPVPGVLNPGLVISRLDSTVSEDAVPNRVRNTTPGNPATSSFGTLTFRRRLINNAGQPITRLRFRIVDVTTLPSIGTGCNLEPAPLGCVADLRAVTATGTLVSVNDPATCAPATAPCNAIVQGTTVESPPDQPIGGAFNSTWSAGSVTLATPLAIGASMNLQFVAGVEQTGADRLYVLLEALPRSGPATTAVIRLAGPGSTPSPTPTPTPGPTTSTFQFDQSVYTVAEDITFTTVTVSRFGNTSGTATVDFATADGTATQKADFTIALGTLTFAPGEVSKTLDILISEDSKIEGLEAFTVSLSNPTGGAGVGPIGTATIQITDDAIEPTTNVNDDPATFVGQHYHDFLNRQHDAAGFAFWTNNITSCGGDQQCIAVRRINTSAAFFLSIEFQQTGFFVIRAQRAAFGRKSDTAASRFTYQEFMRAARRVGEGVIVGQPGFEQRLEDNKQAYATEIVTSAAFITRYSIGLSAEQYVDSLFFSAMVTPTSSERQTAITAFGTGGTTGRVAALRSVADSASLTNAEFNPSFVMMQYYGYLRRNPTDAPDGNDNGYQFWLAKLNLFGGNFINAEMVKAFLLSGEYRDRFGP
ncbi:MAG: Calx-beta domain-containing protein [Pyrinomonadaceae bacterium]